MVDTVWWKFRPLLQQKPSCEQLREVSWPATALVSSAEAKAAAATERQLTFLSLSRSLATKPSAIDFKFTTTTTIYCGSNSLPLLLDRTMELEKFPPLSFIAIKHHQRRTIERETLQVRAHLLQLIQCERMRLTKSETRFDDESSSLPVALCVVRWPAVHTGQLDTRTRLRPPRWARVARGDTYLSSFYLSLTHLSPLQIVHTRPGRTLL